MSSSSSSSSITTVALALLWLSLCSTLVYKHPELLLVFMCFLLCFVWAAVLGMVLITATATTTDLVEKKRAQSRRIKTLVGLTAFTLSLWLLNNNSTNSNFTTTTTTMHWQAAASSYSPEYVTLSLTAGYLAFDHWFSALYCEPPPCKPLVTVIEDALTLTASVIILVAMLVWGNNNHPKNPTMAMDNDWTTTPYSFDYYYHRQVLSTWIVYKIVRLALQLEKQPQQQQQERTHQHQHQQCEPSSSSLVAATGDAAAAASAERHAARAVTSTSTKTTTKTSAKSRHRLHLWVIHGQHYDLRDWVAHHPGGVDAILLGQGRADCTALFESYHPFSIARARHVLEKYRVVDNLVDTTTTSNNNTAHAEEEEEKKDVFYQILKDRVAQTLREQGLDPIRDRAANWQRCAYYLAITSLVLTAAVAHAMVPHWTGSGMAGILASIVLSLVGWLWGALGHDAGHFCASRWPVVNTVGVWAMSILCNPIQWQHQHTYAHHSHTNEFDLDPDLHHFDLLMRVHWRIPQQTKYQRQSRRIIVLMSYSLVCLGTCVSIPLRMLHDHTLYNVVEWTDRARSRDGNGNGRCPPAWYQCRAVWAMLLHLVPYVAFIMVWPFWVHAHWTTALVAVVAHTATSGLVFAFFSQINHLNELSLDRQSRPTKNTNNNDDDRRREKLKKKHEAILKDSWAVEQIETSNNFCHDSLLWHLLSNGLNLQIEHHLFPGLNHCHLPRIQATVQATCEEYGVCYKSYKSWSEIMSATLAWLDKMANEPDRVSFVAGKEQ